MCIRDRSIVVFFNRRRKLIAKRFYLVTQLLCFSASLLDLLGRSLCDTTKGEPCHRPRRTVMKKYLIVRANLLARGCLRNKVFTDKDSAPLRTPFPFFPALVDDYNNNVPEPSSAKVVFSPRSPTLHDHLLSTYHRRPVSSALASSLMCSSDRSFNPSFSPVMNADSTMTERPRISRRQL